MGNGKAEQIDNPPGQEIARFGFDNADDTWLERLNLALESTTLGNIGPYELIEEVSRGGQGIVYRARTTDVARPVALKKLLGGSHASTSARHRFEREIKIVSNLNHPNIVRIFGLEYIKNEPILITEWIDGIPINQWATQQGQSPNDPRHTKLINNFILVCLAVKYAHEKAIIHRDLKPANILVDPEDQPHILDFGLAKSFDQADDSQITNVTEIAQFVGTPAYAAPEQIEATPQGIDTRADIYSLGVILYELLTQHRPYDLGSTYAQAVRAIEQATPARLNSFDNHRNIDRELEAIVFKALERNPEQRYQSAEALIADLSRYQNKQPVLAHPPSTTYQIKKWVARNRVITVFSLAIIILIFAAAATITTLSIQAAQREAGLHQEAVVQRENLRTLYERAQDARIEAEREASKAGEIHRFFDWTLTSIGPRSGKGPDVTMADVLEDADQHIAEFLVDEPAAEAAVRGTIGSTYQSLGQYESAVHHLQLAIEKFQEVYGDDHPRTTLAQANLAASYITTNQLEPAETLILAVLAVERSNPDVDPEKFANHLGFHAEILRRRGLFDQAEPIYLESIEILTATFGADDPITIRALNNLAVLYFNTARYEDARDIFAQILELNQKTGNGRTSAAATSLNNLSGTEMQLGNLEQSEIHLRAAIEIMTEAAPPNHPSIAHYTGNLAQLLFRQQKFAEAEHTYQLAFPLYERIFGEQKPQTASLYQNYAALKLETNELDAAEDYAQRSFEISTALFNAYHPDAIRAAGVLIKILQQSNLDSQARTFLQTHYPDLDQALKNEQTTAAAKTVQQWLENLN